MKYCVIGGRGVVLGFRLVGVEGIIVHNREEAKDAFFSVTGRGSRLAAGVPSEEERPKVLILTEDVVSMLEEEVRDWALQEGSLLVVTGPVFTTETISTIGAGQIAVPDFFYKVLLDYTPPEKKGIAFLFPNRPEQNRRGGIFLYALSIDEIEARTSIDFFPWLPEEEASLEAEADIFLWQ